MSFRDDLETRGIACFPFDERVLAWAQRAHALMPGILADPAHAPWWRHQRTWFVGVDALPNDARGTLPDGPALAGSAIDFVRNELGFAGPWHAGQLSICFPGYPQRDDAENEQAHAFRRNRDAAHLDGLHGEGAAKRRYLREFHHFILGIPLTETNSGAAPFVIWEGSHHLIRHMLTENLRGVAPEDWGAVDLTDAYQHTRRQIFDRCRRTVIHARPGEAYVAHRLSIHGVAPWAEDAAAPPEGRAIAYFRPEMNGRKNWVFG